MGIQTIKVLRTISKIILLVFVLGLLGWGGYYVYRSIAFRPQNIAVTNITDSSATITWTTSSQMNGVVYYRKDSSVLPGPLGIIASQVAYDDRDVSDAQTACVDKFNKNASETKDENFSVSGDNFDCENARVTGMGKYYTHSVTIKDLDPESTYYFAMGDGIWSFKSDVSSVKTFTLLDEVDTPMPVFGKIVGDDGTYSRDSLVYITFRDGSEEQDSIIYSSTSNDDGGWYVDASAIRDSNGNVLPLELGNDSFRIKGRYSNYGESEEETHVYGIFEVGTFDVTVEKQATTSWFWDLLVHKAYAVICGNVGGEFQCGSYSSTEKGHEGEWVEVKNYSAPEVLNTIGSNASTLGYGVALREIAGSSGAIDTQDKATAISQNKVLASEYGYVADKQKGIDVSGVTCTGGSCNYTGETEGNSGMYTCADGSSVYDPTYCGGNSGSSGTGNSGGTGMYTCADGSSVYDPIYCGGNGDEYNEKEEETYECGITPEYGNFQYTADDGRGYQALDGCSACGVSIGAYGCTKTYGVPNLKYEDEELGEYSVNVSELNKVKLLDAQEDNGVSMLEENPTMKESIISELEEIYTNSERTANVATDETVMGIGIGYQKKVRVYCEALGLDLVNATGGGQMCNISEEGSSLFDLHSLIGKAYASENESTDYAFYLPEVGIYSFELGDYTVSSKVSDGKARYLFYIETNGKSGFQMPADPDNPTSEEDIVLDSSAYEITYSQESTAQQYEIEKGINLLSFNFVPVSPDDLGAYMASDLITQAANNGVNIEYISIFSGGRWYSGYSCSSGTCTGTNFSIVPGKGYLVYASDSGDITVPGYNLTSSVPIPFSAGWNLVGVHGYTTAYTARTLIDSINGIDGLTANNVSWWPTSKGKYEGLEVENNTEYGLDFSISPTNGYFVRIADYAPTDTTCKSILWNAGGTANGTCGNTK